MPLVFTFAWVRTCNRGKPNQLNSLLPPCKTVERGSKLSMVKKSSEGAVPCLMSPRKGKRTGEDPSKPLPHFHPRVVKNKGKQVKHLVYK